MKLTVLLDDQLSANRSLRAVHGLSYYIETAGGTVLFDCGPDGTAPYNAALLGKDLAAVDALVLSHGHYDHAGGCPALLQAGAVRAPVYTGPGFFRPKYSRDGAKYTALSGALTPGLIAQCGLAHRTVEGVLPLWDGVWLLSGFARVNQWETIPARFRVGEPPCDEPDPFAEEVCLAAASEDGLVLVAGCSHPGILNMADAARRRLGRPVTAVVGGIHLAEADEARAGLTVEHLCGQGARLLALGHCSGPAVQAQLARRDAAGCHLGCGDVLFF